MLAGAQSSFGRVADASDATPIDRFNVPDKQPVSGSAASIPQLDHVYVVMMENTNYSDVIHHSPTIDLKVLSWLAEGKYLVDRSAPTASLDRLKAQMEAYRVDGVER